jgi:hypothetical protein
VEPVVEGPDPAVVIGVVLDGLRDGVDLNDLEDRIRPWHRDGSTFPAEVLMNVAADAFICSGTTRHDPLMLDGLAERLVPEWPARGNVGHQKHRHAVHGAVLIAAGARPEDTGWWARDDLWQHALLAVAVHVRSAAERRGSSVADICELLRPSQ